MTLDALIRRMNVTLDNIKHSRPDNLSDKKIKRRTLVYTAHLIENYSSGKITRVIDNLAIDLLLGLRPKKSNTYRAVLDKYILNLCANRQGDPAFMNRTEEFLQLGVRGHSEIKPNVVPDIFEEIKEWEPRHAYKRIKLKGEKLNDGVKSDNEDRCKFCHRSYDSFIVIGKGNTEIDIGWDCWDSALKNFTPLENSEAASVLEKDYSKLKKLARKTKTVMASYHKRPSEIFKSVDKILSKINAEDIKKAKRIVSDDKTKYELDEDAYTNLLHSKAANYIALNKYYRKEGRNYLEDLRSRGNIPNYLSVILGNALDTRMRLSNAELLLLFDWNARTAVVDREKSTRDVVSDLNYFLEEKLLSKAELKRYQNVNAILKKDKINLLDLAKVHGVKKDLYDIRAESCEEIVSIYFGHKDLFNDAIEKVLQ